jgi:hypothetical protein
VTLLTLSGPCNDHTLSQLPSQFPGLVSLQLLGSYYASDWCDTSAAASWLSPCTIVVQCAAAWPAQRFGTLSCLLHCWTNRYACMVFDPGQAHVCDALLLLCRGLKRLCKAPQLSALLLDGCEHVTEYGLEVLIRRGARQHCCADM